MSIVHSGGDISNINDGNFFRQHKQFPSLVNNKINTWDFVESVKGIVTLVDKLGTVFAPVKYDINGNIEKIIMCYEMDKESNATLHDLVLLERNKGANFGTDALLWITRALHFIELFLTKLLERPDENLMETIKNELKYAYELTLKQYHGWMTQKLFKLICQMCPTKCQLYKSMNMTDMNILIQDAKKYVEGISANRMEIQNLYKTYKLNIDTVV